MKKLDNIFDEDAELKKGEKQEYPDDLENKKDAELDQDVEKNRLNAFLDWKKKKVKIKAGSEEEEDTEKGSSVEETSLSEVPVNEEKKEQLIMAQTHYSAIVVPKNFKTVFEQIQDLLKQDFTVEVVAVKKFVP